jgi:hypothetical protein
MRELLQQRKIGSTGTNPKAVNLFQSFAWVLAVVAATDIQQQQRQPVVVEVVAGLERLYGQRFSRQCFRVSYGFKCREVATQPVVVQSSRSAEKQQGPRCCSSQVPRTQGRAATGLEQRREHLEQQAR